MSKMTTEYIEFAPPTDGTVICKRISLLPILNEVVAFGVYNDACITIEYSNRSESIYVEIESLCVRQYMPQLHRDPCYVAIKIRISNHPPTKQDNSDIFLMPDDCDLENKIKALINSHE